MIFYLHIIILGLETLKNWWSCVQLTGTMTNVPSSMIGDQFGVVGLLAFIRAADTDPNLVALTPGIDLTTLGLNLNQSE